MKSTREQVYNSINTEREYQDSFINESRGWEDSKREPGKTVGDFITMINYYTHKLNEAYCENEGTEEARKVMRKIAGIAVHCLEANGTIDRL